MRNSYHDAIVALRNNMALHGGSGFDELTEQMVLANLYTLFPNLSLEKMHIAMRTCAFNQELSVLDLKFGEELLDNLIVCDHSRVLSTVEPFVFVSCHYGSYRLIAPLLMQRGRAITLVVDANVATAQASGFTAMFAQYSRGLGLPADRLRIRGLDDGNLAIRLVRDLNEGRSLLIYADVNRGTSTHSVREKRFRTKFFGVPLDARVGIPSIAALADCAIMPIDACRGLEPDDNTITIGAPIYRSGLSRNDFIALALTQIWENIASLVSVNPGQWEALRYVHEYLDLPVWRGPTEKRNGHVAYDKRRIAFKAVGEIGEIFDRRLRTVTPITGVLLNLFRQMDQLEDGTSLEAIGLNPDVIGWLSDKGFARIDCEGL